MKREKVIIFEGEHMFVAPKNTVYDKNTGMTHTVPEFANLVDPRTAQPLDVITTGGIAGDTDTGTQNTNIVSSGTARYAGTDTTVSPIGGGGAVRTPIVEQEITTSSTTSTTTAAPKIEQTLNVPLNLGLPPLASTMARGGGGGGGGGAAGEAKPQANVFVTLLKKYWWVGLIVAAGVGGYFIAKRKK